MPFRYVLTLSLLFLAVPALAIDCGKAASDTEKRICADFRLRQLDAVLGESWRTYRSHASETGAHQQQRDWLKERDRCTDVACLKSAYAARIAALSGRENVSILTTASPEWDFIVNVGGCDYTPYVSVCESAGTIDVFAKDAGEHVQRIVMENMILHLSNEERRLSENLVEVYDEKTPSLTVLDFNFDGHADVSVHNGNMGSYGGSSYDIYLFNPADRRFVHSKSLSRLASDSLGTDINPADRTWITTNKSGCCWHISSTYLFEKGEPILIGETIWDNVNDPDMTIVIERRLVDGQWVETRKREPRDED